MTEATAGDKETEVVEMLLFARERRSRLRRGAESAVPEERNKARMQVMEVKRFLSRDND